MRTASVDGWAMDSRPKVEAGQHGSLQAFATRAGEWEDPLEHGSELAAKHFTQLPICAVQACLDCLGPDTEALGRFFGAHLLDDAHDEDASKRRLQRVDCLLDKSADLPARRRVLGV